MGFRCREGPPLPVTATPTARTLDDRCTSTRDVASNVSNAQTADICQWRGERVKSTPSGSSKCKNGSAASARSGNSKAPKGTGSH
jgi:hypothetical protein